MTVRRRRVWALLLFAMAATLAAPVTAKVRPNAIVGGGNGAPSLLPIGQYITPTIAPGATYQALRTGLRADGNADANGAITTALSPDGKTLLVLTSGYNNGLATAAGVPITVPFSDPLTGLPSAGTTTTFQWIFVYDVTSGTPVQVQQIALPSAFDGLVWSPDGATFYASGGQDDRVYIYKRGASGWVPDAPFVILNHNSNGTKPRPTYDGGIFKGTPLGSALAALPGLLPGAQTAGLGVSADGKYLFVANIGNDSVSIVDITRRAVVREITLYAAGSGIARGEYPLWVTPLCGPDGRPKKVYVTSLRDGQVIAIDKQFHQTVIAVGGEPNKMVLSENGAALYVANGDRDEIDVIDTATDVLRRVIPLRRPAYRYRGANPNSLALGRRGRELFVTLAGENAVAVVDIASGRVRGRIPTGWYPSSVSVSADGGRLFVANFKSNAGPSGGNTNDATRNEYVLETEKAGLLTLPVPDRATLGYLSAIVDANDGFDINAGLSPMMTFLRKRIKHVIFIQRENRTYDQVLGDLPIGNGDPALTTFPQPITPNAHALALEFGDLDNLYAAGDVSVDGWNWDYQGHANDTLHQAVTLNYANDGFNGASPIDRLQNLALPISNPANPTAVRLTSLLDPSGRSTVEPGPKAVTDDEGTGDEASGQTGGYIWDSVIRAGLSVRHYGQYDDETEYTRGLPVYLPIVRNAAAAGKIQGIPRYAALFNRTDPFFRGWDLDTPDEYRFEEWNREFQTHVATNSVPSFEFMCIMLDHTGNFATNVAHLNTPELELASNDHAIGQIVAAVSHSAIWSSTVIFIQEDDAQAGQDHIDAHREVGFVISPWSKHGKVVHTLFNSDSILRTVEDLLGADHLGLNDANSASMDDAFSTTPNMQRYTAIIPGNLCEAPVDPTLVPACANPAALKSLAVPSRHTGAWWQAKTRGLSFSGPDQNDPVVYDKILWNGLVGDRPYPQIRSGLDLSVGRAALLERVPTAVAKVSGATAIR